MINIKSKFYTTNNVNLHYYEVENKLQPLVMIHAQGVDGLSFDNTYKILSRKYHIFSVDCYGHGDSLHDAEQYNIKNISYAIIEFIRNVINDEIFLLGHSSGGLIAAYIAAETNLCRHLILEDPPFFSCQGERRKQTFNYVDLSSICHQFINQKEEKDFVLYYFSNQYVWNFFPKKSRDKLRTKLINFAAKDRKKHSDKNLKVMFWPKSALSSFKGMNKYDPLFGETFYSDIFHAGIAHEEILKKINCRTTFMKAITNIDESGLLLAALSEEDLHLVCELIPNCNIKRFECGHGIHIEKTKDFIECLMNLEK